VQNINQCKVQRLQTCWGLIIINQIQPQGLIIIVYAHNFIITSVTNYCSLAHMEMSTEFSKQKPNMTILKFAICWMNAININIKRAVGLKQIFTNSVVYLLYCYNNNLNTSYDPWTIIKATMYDYIKVTLSVLIFFSIQFCCKWHIV
jgi:hypothetical protein